jgi:hypothetical protein
MRSITMGAATCVGPRTVEKRRPPASMAVSIVTTETMFVIVVARGLGEAVIGNFHIYVGSSDS